MEGSKEGVEKEGGRPHTAEVIGSWRQVNVWSGKRLSGLLKMSLVLPKLTLSCRSVS